MFSQGDIDREEESSWRSHQMGKFIIGIVSVNSLLRVFPHFFFFLWEACGMSVVSKDG